jgi:butyryl-CoA dehydrogenase
LRGVEVVELVFEEVVVPADNVLGGVGRGFEIARDALDGSCIGVAAQAAGILAACLADSVKYARERQQFGKPIAQFYPIQHAIAGMAADLEVSRLLTLKAAWLRGAGKPHSQEAAMAKLFATEAADRGATKAVQVHGGAGYLKDFAVERYYRDAKMMGALDGTSDGERLRVGREILGV